MLDEVDAIWKRGKSDESAEALRAIVNAGHRKGAAVGRATKTGQLERLPVCAPVALAGIGSCLPDTVLDRSVIVRMRRRAPGEQVAEFRNRTARPEGEELRVGLAAWADSVAKMVGDPWPVMPRGITDRPADVWEPLLAVADLVGGDWPALARAACVAFVTGSRDDSASVGVRLLQDLHGVFGNADAMWTEKILGKLHAISEGPWADWYGKPLDARQLAKMLKPYEVGSHLIRIGTDVARGYRRADLADPWSRYGVPARGSVTRVTSVTPLTRPVTLVTAVTDTPPRECALCQRPFVPEHPSRIVCPRCRPHLAGATIDDEETTP
jgi:hypothetical protein